MRNPPPQRISRAVCAHDCPSACALDVQLDDQGKVQRVYGSTRNPYTDGVICAKVARYADYVHSPERLQQPMMRRGLLEGTPATTPATIDDFVPTDWDTALDHIARVFTQTIEQHGRAAILPYHYAGTMGHVMRGVHKAFRHAGGFTGQLETVCTHMSTQGWLAGVGRLIGPDPREMIESDLIVVWGCNPASTHVNVMRHIAKARKARNARLVVIDPYRTQTAAQADLHLAPRPGTDGALACAIMHVMLRNGHADRPYMRKFADDPEGFEAHLSTRTPEWAEDITGIPAAQIEEFAKMYGEIDRAYIRVGIGFSRSRNGPMQVHAVSCLPVVGGKWQHTGGGAFYSSSGWGGEKLDKTLLEGLDAIDRVPRSIDMSRLAEVLNGDPEALQGDKIHTPEGEKLKSTQIHAMLIQGTNPLAVCPDQNRLRAGFARPDLFVVVHEQFFTETCQFADVILPATNFLEHDDIYTSYGQAMLDVSMQVVAPTGHARNNHQLITELAMRMGIDHPTFDCSPEEKIEQALVDSGLPSIAEITEKGGIDLQGDAEETHFRKRFGHPDGKFHFRPDWAGRSTAFAQQSHLPYPTFADHYDVIEQSCAQYPFRLVTAPAKSYLNSSFTHAEGSKKKAGRPELQIGQVEAEQLGISDGEIVRITSRQGSIRVHARIVIGAANNVVVIESLYPDRSFLDGQGVNFLTSTQGGAAVGGAVFHDTAISVTKNESVAS